PITLALHSALSCISFLFSSKPPPPTDIYTLSLHDALPIWWDELFPLCIFAIVLPQLSKHMNRSIVTGGAGFIGSALVRVLLAQRSEEHTSELQSRGHLVCRLLLEKKKKTNRRSECTIL